MAGEPTFTLRLYVAGAAPHSLRAIEVVSAFCEHRLGSRCHLDVIDLYERPELACELDLVALPALVRERPLPRRTLVGDFLDESAVLRALDLPEAQHR